MTKFRLSFIPIRIRTRDIKGVMIIFEQFYFLENLRCFNLSLEDDLVLNKTIRRLSKLTNDGSKICIPAETQVMK